MESEFYTLSATLLNGEERLMSDYQGKTLLIINTASRCSFTPQLKGLERIYRKFQAKGLVILGFPCSQFGNQEPEDEASITTDCILKYDLTFPMFAKIYVNGRKTHPIFATLKQAFSETAPERIKWNFTKFLVDPSGVPIKQFSPLITPEQLDHYLDNYFDTRLLSQYNHLYK